MSQDFIRFERINHVVIVMGTNIAYERFLSWILCRFPIFVLWNCVVASCYRWAFEYSTCESIFPSSRQPHEVIHRSVRWLTIRIPPRNNRAKRRLGSSITILATCPERPSVVARMTLSSKPTSTRYTAGAINRTNRPEQSRLADDSQRTKKSRCSTYNACLPRLQVLPTPTGRFGPRWAITADFSTEPPRRLSSDKLHTNFAGTN
jgi:hypothetical protein